MTDIIKKMSDRSSIADIYELSPIQAGMLFHRIYAPESAAYFEQFSCKLIGGVNLTLLRKAWQQLIDRHDILRTSFHWKGLNKPVQVVHRTVSLPWTVQDWRDLEPCEQASRWHEHLEHDRALGFDPEIPPLLRCTLARLNTNCCYFSWSHHHLLLDGWCLNLVLSELFGRYESLLEHRRPTAIPVHPFREYIEWQQQRDKDALTRHWRDSLAGFTAATPLPMRDSATPIAGGWADATAERLLSASRTRGLRRVAAKHRLTLNTLMQGAWALLLHRYSGQRDIVFGTTVSGRPPEVSGIETMLGVFINTVPVRVEITPDTPATSWLERLQCAHAARDAAAAITLSDIHKLSDIQAGTHLFESNLIVMNYRLDENLVQGAAGIQVRDVHTFDRTDIPLTLQVTPGDQLSLEIAYDSRLFDADTIDRILGHLDHLISNFCSNLEQPLSSFEILPFHELYALVTTFNSTAAPLDETKTIIDIWEQRVAESPEAIALQFEDIEVSFQELNERANRLARELLRVAPLNSDDRVGLALRRSDWLVAAILAVWKCGAAYVPIDPDFPESRVKRLLEDAAPRITLTDESLTSLVKLSQDQPGTNLDRTISSSNLAYVIFTSGSTGRPKGAMIEHLGMMNHMLSKLETYDLTSNSAVVQNASHCFDVSVWQFFAAMLGGGRTIIYPDQLVLDPDRFLQHLESDQATILEVVPSYLSALLDRLETDPRPLRHLRYLLVTGEMVKPALLSRWFANYPSIPAVNAYGPAEAADDVTQAVIHEPPTAPTVPVGRPIRNTHIYIVDDQTRLCPIGVKGEICVSGAGVGRGYLNDPVRTDAAFCEDPFTDTPGVRMYRTGDVGAINPDGTILMFGRRDAQVKIRGHRVELGDVEAAVTALTGVRDAAVLDHDNRSTGTYLAAYVTLRPGEALESQHVLEQLADALPDYMIPSSCTILKELPLSPNGKVDRNALPAPDLSYRPRGTAYIAPQTPTEEIIADLWSKALGITQPGIHDNFFSIGGDSILSMQIASRAARAGLTLTPRDIFEYQTISKLAEAAHLNPVRPKTIPARTPGPAPLTPVQRQFFEDVTIDRNHYNQSIAFEVPSSFDPTHCSRALDAVVRHHDALRLRFVQVDGEWQQQEVETGTPQAVSIHDLSAFPPKKQHECMRELAATLHRSLDIEHGELLGAVYFQLGEAQSGRLLLVVHHLAMDGVSWRIMLEDLRLAYEQLCRSDPITLPPVQTTYLQWADTLADWANSDEIAADLPYWTGSPYQTASTLLPPRDPAATALDTVDHAEEEELVFDEDETEALLTETRQALKAGPTELLLAVTALAFIKAFGKRTMVLDLEVHGREEPNHLDLTRTVGWFTSTFPIVLDVHQAPEAEPRHVVHALKEQLRTLPHRGVSHGLLRYSSTTESANILAGMPRAAVLFNYHGRLDLDGDGDSDWRP